MFQTPQLQMGKSSTYLCLHFLTYRARIVVGIRWRMECSECCQAYSEYVVNVSTIIYSFPYHCALDKKNYLEQLEYAPLQAASLCSFLLCPLPGTPSAFLLCQNPNCVSSCPISSVFGAKEAFSYPLIEPLLISEGYLQKSVSSPLEGAAFSISCNP